jgi:hypothetical protein
LYLSGRAMPPESLWAVLKEHKEQAQEAEEPIGFTLAGEEVVMRAGGLGRYTFRLDHRYGFIGLTMSKALPTLRFQPLAEFLHGVGPRNMVDWFGGWMRDVLNGVRLTAARVDVFADTTGWALQASDRHRFLCRADLRDTHEKGDAWTGFEFGRHKGGNVMARIYDKTRDVNEHPAKAWWFDIWGDQLTPGETVRRVEIEFGRTALRQFGLDTPDDVFDGLGDLWRYGTQGWLTFRTPSADATKARWPVAPEWDVVQDAELSMPALGVMRTYAAKDAASYAALLPGLTGYASAVAARKGAVGLVEARDAIWQALDDYERSSDVLFADRVATKVHRNSMP